jgi:AP-1 complex subunit beta-1
MTVAPALLEELLGEIGSLASAYQYVHLFLDCRIFIYLKLCIFRLADNQFSAQKVLQTVVAGRQAENLLQVFSFSGHRKTLMTSYIF